MYLIDYGHFNPWPSVWKFCFGSFQMIWFIFENKCYLWYGCRRLPQWPFLSDLEHRYNLSVISVTLLILTSAAPLSVALSLFSNRKEGKRGHSEGQNWKGYRDNNLYYLTNNLSILDRLFTIRIHNNLEIFPTSPKIFKVHVLKVLKEVMLTTDTLLMNRNFDKMKDLRPGFELALEPST